MIWVTWRQHRIQFLGGAIICGLLIAFLLFTGLGMRATYHALGIDACVAAVPAQDCSTLVTQFHSQYSGLQFLIPLFLLLPALLGLFWGAPLIAREVEQGTHRLAWTQSVTRRRWTVTKLAVVAGAAVLLSSAYSAMLWWWAAPLLTGAASSRFSQGIFDLLGIVPVTYTLFAIALGVAAGVLLQRTTSAMVATLFGFAVVRLGVELWLRPNYQKAVTSSYTFLGTSGPPDGSWILSEDTVTASGMDVSGGQGRGLSFDLIHQICPNLSPGPGSKDSSQMQQCIRDNGIHVAATFQPSDRYWLFQGIESALFVVLAIALVTFSVWWVRRRVR
jgi:hypothetical protein